MSEKSLLLLKITFICGLGCGHLSGAISEQSQRICGHILSSTSSFIRTISNFTGTGTARTQHASVKHSQR